MLNAKNFRRQHKRAAIRDMLLELLMPYSGNMKRKTIRKLLSTKGKGKFLREYIALQKGAGDV